MKRYEPTRRTLRAEIIKIAVGPILIAALWFYWLFEYLPFPDDGPPPDEFILLIVNGFFLSLAFLWAGIKMWAITRGELTIFVGNGWIRLPVCGRLEAPEFECFRSRSNADQPVFEFKLRNPSRLAGKNRTVKPSDYDGFHELVCDLDGLCNAPRWVNTPRTNHET